MNVARHSYCKKYGECEDSSADDGDRKNNNPNNPHLQNKAVMYMTTHKHPTPN